MKMIRHEAVRKAEELLLDDRSQNLPTNEGNNLSVAEIRATIIRAES